MLRDTLAMHYRMHVDHHIYDNMRKGLPHTEERWTELVENRRKGLRAMLDLLRAQAEAH